jgi:hypothetical protein
MAGSAVGPADENQSEFRPPRQAGIPFKSIEEAGTFDIAGEAGRGYVMLKAFTKTALARKLTNANDLKRNYPFGRGAVSSSRLI